MATCAYQDLLDVNPCLVALNDHLLEVVITQQLCNLLDKIENAGEVTCDIATLLEQGKCFAALPAHVLKAIQAQLICDISEAL